MSSKGSTWCCILNERTSSGRFVQAVNRLSKFDKISCLKQIMASKGQLGLHKKLLFNYKKAA